MKSEPRSHGRAVAFFEFVSAARLASLASGRGGLPVLEEWPFVIAILAAIGFLGSKVLIAMGLTRVEAILFAAAAPVLVLFDAPLGRLSPTVTLAANVAGCLIPAAIAIKVVLERRIPFAESFLLVGVGVVVSYFASHVEPDRGVLLQYRIPAICVGVLAAGLLYRAPAGAGAAGFAAGALGVVLGADVLHLAELGGGSGRVILGGAGLLDGIVLVAVLSGAVAELTAALLRVLVKVRAPSRPAV